jgi:hypothetical protein
VLKSGADWTEFIREAELHCWMAFPEAFTEKAIIANNQRAYIQHEPMDIVARTAVQQPRTTKAGMHWKKCVIHGQKAREEECRALKALIKMGWKSPGSLNSEDTEDNKGCFKLYSLYARRQHKTQRPIAPPKNRMNPWPSRAKSTASKLKPC